jgi:DNA repair ATPase RecN
MNVIEDEEEQQKKEPTPTIETLEQKIEELATSIDDLRTIHYMYTSRKKAIKNLIREVRQLASDLNVDEIQFRKMISRIFVKTGVSQSWLRKLLL